MNCCITELREKEVINICDGQRLGEVSDIEIDTCSGCVISIVIWKRSKCFGLIGKPEDIKIKWSDIKVIGDDTILVNYENTECCDKCSKPNILENIFQSR